MVEGIVEYCVITEGIYGPIGVLPVKKNAYGLYLAIVPSSNGAMSHREVEPPHTCQNEEERVGICCTRAEIRPQRGHP